VVALLGLLSGWSRSDVLGLLSIVVSVVGFGIAAWQLTRTANATIATRDAVRKSGRTQVLFLLPQFRLLETELDYAIDAGRNDLAARVLTSYSHLANEVAGLLEAQQLAESSALISLRESARTASACKGSIFTSDESLASLTEPFRAALTDISSLISSLQAQSGVGLSGSK
jgi:hypothetical protein